MISIDLHYSNWILLWYVFYQFNLIAYNPKFWFIIALCANCYNFFYMFYFRRKYILLLFSIIVILCKGIPMWTLRNTKIHKKDIIFGLFLFIIYNMWLTHNNITFLSIFRDFYVFIKKNDITMLENNK